MEKIGIYGGTFNPPHIGHIIAAKQAMEKLHLDKLVIVPDGEAPHKKLPDNSPSASDRLRMVEIAASGIPNLYLSDMELHRQGPSYTYQTVLELREELPEDRLYLIVGTDMFLCLDKWEKSQVIFAETVIAVLHRGTMTELSRISDQKLKLERMGARVVLVENVATPISSTDVRRLLAFRAGSEYLNPKVEEYIRKRGLYGTGEDYRNLPMDGLKKVVCSLLNENRVAHVLGCRDTAIDLARRFGADEENAGRAGMLHDITKALDGPLQLTMCRDYGILLDEFSAQNPKTLHALTGSLVAQRIFGENAEVVRAIRYHTTGRARMTKLEKILYIADYIEPNRDFPGVERLRQETYNDLDRGVRLGLEMTVDLLKSKKSAICPDSVAAIRDLGGIV